MTDKDIVGFLRRSGLATRDETPNIQPLAGGVSSDIWKVTTAAGAVCVKRALPTLKTDKEWHAPVERNANEADWIRTAGMITPGAVPEILAEDQDASMFAMSFMEPAENPVWKEQLRDGVISTKTAADVGDALGHIHAATADNASVAERFATDDVFHELPPKCIEFWSTAMSARKTYWSALKDLYFSTPNVRGTETRPSISHFVSTIYY